MIENTVRVVTKYGLQPAFAACPDAPGQFPGIILYMDAPGIREELHNMARRIATHGYFCLVPDLYYRLGTLRFDIPRRNDAMSVVIRGAMQSLSNTMVADDTAGMLAFLDAQDKVSRGPVGCVGFCMSGAFAITAAARFPRVGAAASLYGIDLVSAAPDSPHRLLDRVAGELYIAFAEVDPAVPSSVVPALEAALAGAGTRHRIETLPGSHHGFSFAARNDYDPVAAEHSFAAMLDLWNRNLK